MKPAALRPAVTTPEKEVTAPAACADEASPRSDHWDDGTRAAPHLTVDQLPERPSGVVCVSGEVAARSIERVSTGHRSELLEAATEIRANEPTVREDLGRRAPNVAEVARLQQRVTETSDSLHRLEGLTAVTRQQHDVAVSDLSRIVRRVAAQVAFEQDDDPSLSERYRRSVAYVALRGSDIAEGMDRARRERELVAKAKAKAEAVKAASSDKPADTTKG